MKEGKRQPEYVVEVFHGNDAWWIDARGPTNVVRICLANPRKVVAVTAARGLASMLRAELVIKGKSGRILKRDSHGHDPRGRG